MNEEKLTMKWSFFLIPVCVAVPAGLVLGWLSKTMCGGFSALVIGVGGLVGLAIGLFIRQTWKQQLILAVMASCVGLALFTWMSFLPSWQAETEIGNNDLDDLCVRVVSMRFCHERKIMGVFDFRDVPEEVLGEAKTKVEHMSIGEKQEICNQTFGKRINTESVISSGRYSIISSSIWIVLALSVSMIPTLLTGRNSGN